MKTFCFTSDDNIRFLRELTEGDYASLFHHPYTAMYRRLHEKHGLKVQLNLFYETPGFDLSRMTDRFRAEWIANAHWLRLSFHSRAETDTPYACAGYREVYDDCAAVHREILRFAGEASLARTTTIHYCQTTADGLRALRDLGVTGLMGLYGSDASPCTSYGLPEEDAARLRRGDILHRHGMDFHALNLIVNNCTAESLPARLDPFLHRDRLRLMIHEQYFYPDYPAYQPDFADKLDAAFALLRANGFESRFAEEMGR